MEITTAEAFAFLNQATFGATEDEAERVIALRFEDWIDAQMDEPPSLSLPHLQSLPRPVILNTLQVDRVDVWFRNAVAGPDQLRQRVAFALSEIFVVSQLGALVNAPYALASYNDMLVENAFGNYRELMTQVTLHPAMGVYLSMLGNEKPDPVRNIRPDENYARELMQLFTIGLVELNADGTPVLDGNGQPVPTYDQSIIEGFAHVYTGWHYAGAASFETAQRNDNNQTIPMQLYPEFHDTGTKTLLGGETIPAGQTGEQDLDDALDNVFNHPNVGPFVARALIQRLVSSNPSPGFVARVAAVFDDNGAGVRGDLGAVVKALLLDDEARGVGTPTSGKLKEPLLRLTQLWRAFGASSTSGRFPFLFSYVVLGQGPLQSPSVFNFFSPSFSPQGEMRSAGLAAPEMQIATEYFNTFTTNYFFNQCFVFTSENTDLAEDDIFIDIGEEMDLATDVDALIDRVGSKLLGGPLTPTLRAEIRQMLLRLTDDDAALRAGETIYLIVTSPEYALQR